MNRGFTLIELIVAISLAALFFAAAVMGVGALTGSKARSAAGELSATVRSLYDTASLTGKTCRLVFALPNRSDDAQAKYWAECAAGNVTTSRDRDATLHDDAQAAAEEARRGKKDDSPAGSESTYQELVTQEKNRVENAAKFSAFNSEEVKPRELKGVQIRVWTRHQKDAVGTGLAYLYFFPQGFTERAQLYFKQGKNVWTVTVAPLTGRTKIVGEELEVPRS